MGARRVITQADCDKVAALQSEGLSLRELARRAGCHPDTARRILSKMGVATPAQRALNAALDAAEMRERQEHPERDLDPGALPTGHPIALYWLDYAARLEL